MLKKLRKLHLYLGCLFAPIVVFFAISGMLQTFGLHESAKGEAPPPAWIAHAAAIHKSDHYSLAHGAEPSHPFQFFVLLMALGLVVTSSIGVYMAFVYKNDKRVVIALLAAGVLLPVLALALA